MAKADYVCKTCGNRYTEKTKRGHAKMFGHTQFTKDGKTVTQQRFPK
jgi:hypothetical protein